MSVIESIYPRQKQDKPKLNTTIKNKTGTGPRPVPIHYLKLNYFACSKASVTVVMSQTSAGP